MISDKLTKAINDQINLEFNSAYLYLAMAAKFEDANLPGFAKWMKAQYGEEVGHGMKLFGYLADRSGKIELGAIDKPASEFGSPLETFRKVLEHERKVTASINKLYESAMTEKDYAAQAFLLWFVNEQVEEEKTAEDIIHQIEAVGSHAHLLLMIDRHLGSREG